MTIRAYQPSDYAQILDLTCDTFQPFFEESFPAHLGHEVGLVDHQCGHWREDYQRQLPQLLPPDGEGHALVAIEDDELLGYVIWRPDTRPDHAHVEILAVAARARRRGLAESLMSHAMDDVRSAGKRFVEIGTGGDGFHEPARRLYEHLGFHAMPLFVYLRDLEAESTSVGQLWPEEALPSLQSACGQLSRSATLDARPVLYLTVGLPGAGKTTMAKEVAGREGIARLTPDDWMAPLFGDSEADGRRDVIEGRLLDIAHQVLVSGAGVVVDFGCWSPEERWAIRAIAEASGARSQLLVADVSEAERRRRARVRWAEAPETTFEMTEADHDNYLAAYQPPTKEELDAPDLPPRPDGYATWGHWASWRWPTLPVIPTTR